MTEAKQGRAASDSITVLQGLNHEGSSMPGSDVWTAILEMEVFKGSQAQE